MDFPALENGKYNAYPAVREESNKLWSFMA
jgi:hypothetical protein